MNKELLLKIKEKAKEILETNTRFHCYAHAIEVYENVIKLLGAKPNNNLDEIVLFTAALLHDVSNSSDNSVEGKEGAEIAEGVLKEIKDFPSEKIEDVKRLIKSINEDREKTDDEIIIDTADEMAAFSELGLIRSFMISGSKGMKVKDAIEWELAYLEKRFSHFKLDIAKVLVTKQYNLRKVYLQKILENYPEMILKI